MKAAYIDFSKPEYSDFSKKEIHTLKTINSIGNRKNLGDCGIHGLHARVSVTKYDMNGGESNYYGCPQCLHKQ